jgi:hypothetical protein
MKKIGRKFLFSVCVLSLIVIAQMNSQVTVLAEKNTERTRKIVSSEESQWLLSPFDPTVSRLPEEFNGHNVRTLYENVKKRQEAVKGEFETTAEYNQRKRNAEAQAILGNADASDIFAFVISNASRKDRQSIIYINTDQIQTNYDADLNLMKVASKFEPAYIKYTASKDYGRLKWGSWLFLNDVSQSAVSEYGLVINNPLAFSFKPENRASNQGQFSHSLNMDIPTARKAKEQIAVLVVAKLVEPHLMDGFLTFKGRDRKDYSIMHNYINVKMTEYWIFNYATGEIYHKENAK